MGNFSLGSIQVEVQNLIENVPTVLSGTNMHPLIDRKRQFVEEYTGTIIGSNSIGIKHQDIIVNLSAAQVLKGMLLTGIDAEEVRLGDLTVRKGIGGNVAQGIKQFEEEGMQQLKLLGKKVTTYQAYYG